MLLLEAGSLGGGASGACAGRAQICEGPRGAHMDLVLAGLARLEALEAELDAPFEWRRLGNLVLIEHERHWQPWVEQIAYLQQRGVMAAMLDPADLAAAEPLLRGDRFRGAAWCLEGHLNPLKLIRAYAVAARRLGARLRPHTPATGFQVTGGRVTGVKTAAGLLSAGAVLVTAGAWTGDLLAAAGGHLPVQFTHAEALISEPLPPLLHHHIGLADFYETIHTAERAVSIGVAQQMSGALLVTEAVQRTRTIHRTNSGWGIPALARDLLTKISSKPFDHEFIKEKIALTNAAFNIENGTELVDQISRSLLPYSAEKQPIYLLLKDGRKITLENSENQILSSYINQPNTKYILSFPREI